MCPPNSQRPTAEGPPILAWAPAGRSEPQGQGPAPACPPSRTAPAAPRSHGSPGRVVWPWVRRKAGGLSASPSPSDAASACHTEGPCDPAASLPGVRPHLVTASSQMLHARARVAAGRTPPARAPALPPAPTRPRGRTGTPAPRFSSPAGQAASPPHARAACPRHGSVPAVGHSPAPELEQATLSG